MFRIGEFARFTRVSVKMLRHWDETGLLRPARVDPATGYRYYGVDQLPRLNRIVLLRDLGFGLDEIGELLHADLDEIYARRERVLIAAVEHAQTQLRAVRARRELMRGGTTPADVVVRTVESMLVATLSGGAGQDVGELFYRLETHVRDLGARAGRPPLTILPEPDDETVTVAVPLTWLIPPMDGGDVRLLHAVPRMACAVHRGGYGGLPGLLQRMLRWLQHAGEQPAGRIREVYLRFGAEPELGLPRAYLTDERANLVTELQVPLLTA
jgi:DNA-binding transcriptional MerR regulator